MVHESITALSSMKLAWSEAHQRLSFSRDDCTLHRGRIYNKALEVIAMSSSRGVRSAMYQPPTHCSTCAATLSLNRRIPSTVPHDLH
eukprot:1626702-Pleurochrysis_carterae.AAC.1